MSKKAEGFSLRFVLINTGNISRKVLPKVLRSFDKNFERLHEPTGALDTETTKEIMKVFMDLNKQGKTIVIVTHDLAVAEQCGRVIKIEDGKMIE